MVTSRKRVQRVIDVNGVSLVAIGAAPSGVGGTDADTAQRQQAVLNGISQQARGQLIDILIDTVGRSGRVAQDMTPASAPSTTRPWPCRA